MNTKQALEYIRSIKALERRFKEALIRAGKRFEVERFLNEILPQRKIINHWDKTNTIKKVIAYTA